MSALGQKRTSPYVRVMSALPPKADMAQRGRDKTQTLWCVAGEAEGKPLLTAIANKPSV
jgi:hypothetical protein